MSFAFLHSFSSTNSLTIKDQPDVCSLSCGVRFKPLSTSLQNGLRFFWPPVPAQAIGFAYAQLSPKGAVRGCHVPYERQNGLGSSSPPIAHLIAMKECADFIRAIVPFGQSVTDRFAPLRLTAVTDVYVTLAIPFIPRSSPY